MQSNFLYLYLLGEFDRWPAIRIDRTLERTFDYGRWRFLLTIDDCLFLCRVILYNGRRKTRSKAWRVKLMSSVIWKTTKNESSSEQNTSYLLYGRALTDEPTRRLCQGSGEREKEWGVTRRLTTDGA